jgi:hypothetical protein
MNKASLQSLFLSMAILIISTVGGALIAQKLAKGNAGFSFLWCGCTIATLILLSQLLMFQNAKKKLFFQLLYFGFFGFSMTWFMLSLSFPIFWTSEISITGKSILALTFLVIMILNFNLGWQILNKKWIETDKHFFSTGSHTLWTGDDWNRMIKSMKITHNIFIPGISEKWVPVLSILLILFMIAGLNLRNVYPMFSVFAWGVPATVMASYFIQVSGSYFAQAAQVRAIEKNLQYNIKSTS